MLDPMTAKITSFRVLPALPESLAPLLEIAHNLWWTWQPRASALFEQLDPDLWEQTHHNPVKLLSSIDQASLNRAAEDPAFVHAVDQCVEQLRGHQSRPSWFQEQYQALPCPEGRTPLVAYFSAEFGLTECFQIYSGGLGCLAGDHLKSASELGVPLVGVGLLYRNGYFHQYLNADGWQQETYPDLEFPNQPIHRIIDPETKKQRIVWIDLPGRKVAVGIWQCNVGRVTLYLLDTNLEENSREDRDITRNLYGGDVESRIKQELVLGVAGVRALESLGVHPTVYHMNEGHSAFLALEHIRQVRRDTDLSFEEARIATSASHLFTTHTPVPAGIDRFSPELIDTYLSPLLPELGIDRNHLLSLGRERTDDDAEFFSMAVLALKTSDQCNGVSKLHGEVSRSMWTGLWPGVPVNEAPISHVTNGVHTRSWIAPGVMALFDRHLGWSWQRNPADHTVWNDVENIPDEELWRTHAIEREHLVTWSRKRIREQLSRRGLRRADIEHAAGALDPEILTIGFARRFATYKRATLLLHDPDRLRNLLNDADRPIQILIAGKAHPADGPGKEMIRELVKFAESNGKSNRIVFLEDYDIDVARRLVAGCDIWLNTPRRGMEASGTSGMKAAMNGVINVSILDGWWDEGFETDMGFAIGRGEIYDDAELQDKVEGRALYDLLERQIIPEFYQRDSSGLPRQWIARMKRCITSVAPEFNTNRMVADYTERHYLPAANSGLALANDHYRGAKALTAQLARYAAHWESVRIETVDCPIRSTVRLGDQAPVKAVVNLGALEPHEVAVELYAGAVTSLGELVDVTPMELQHGSALGDGRHEFTGSLTANSSGRYGFSVRVLPKHELLTQPMIPGMVAWFGGEAPDAISSDKNLVSAQS